MTDKEILENKLKLNEKTKFDWFGEKEFEAIENLIKENKELKEKNEKRMMLELNKEIIIVNNKMYAIDNELYNDLLNDIIDNYIPKSKVKEKIEELEKQAEEVKIHYKGTYACLDEYLNAKSKIQGFKELLEEGE